MTPQRPPRVCADPRCGRLVYGGSHCPEHAQTRARDDEQYRFYRSQRWRGLSELVRKQEPVCRLCRKAPSKITDHVDGDWRNNARENLRALCVDCNATHTAKQHRAKSG